MRVVSFGDSRYSDVRPKCAHIGVKPKWDKMPESQPMSKLNESNARHNNESQERSDRLEARSHIVLDTTCWKGVPYSWRYQGSTLVYVVQSRLPPDYLREGDLNEAAARQTLRVRLSCNQVR
jgi:hypothetical protein